jgi:REP element-mobilizing transposase RayT
MIDGIFRRRRLPHWDVADATYFVTACLADSIPARGLNTLRIYRHRLDRESKPGDLTEGEWEDRKHKLVFAKLDEIIDLQPASRLLADDASAQIVRDALLHFAGERYWLLAYVVMPSHFHWLFRPTPEYCDLVAKEADERTPRERIMHSIKCYTANQCNRLLGRTGEFWQDESYDHCVRTDDELLRIIEYIENNPVKARLVGQREEWKFSSAKDRLVLKTPWGEPLPRVDIQ